MIAALVKHRTTVLVATLAIFLFGMWSYRSLPREAAPDVNIPVVLVVTPYVGVSPADIESLVTIPIENELSSLKGIDELRSTSAEGASMISIEFEPDVNIDEALQRVRDRVDRARASLPDDVEEPDIREVSFEDFPFMIVVLAGEIDEVALKDLGEDLRDGITRIPGVLDADLSGGLTREIRVQVDPARLGHYGLSLNNVIGAIDSANVNVPGGTVAARDTSFLLRVPGEFASPEEIENVAIKRVGDRPVFVRDVARVVDGYADRDTYSRMNGRPSVSLGVKKRAGANMVEIAEQVKIEVAEQAERWPAGVDYRITADQSVRVENMVSELENNIITALLLVVGVIVFFMGLRNSLFVALAIPLSMLSAFVVIDVLGITLNMVVLFSLILALGMLVDNAIVVVENVYRHMEMGKTSLQAAVEGTREVAGAVAASTATTVAAFLPLAFWSGVMGEFMGYLPKTVIIVLVSSLVVAVGILPSALSRLLKRTQSGETAAVRDDDPEALLGEPGTWRHAIMSRYRRLLEWSIHRPFRSSALGFVSFVITVAAFAVFNHGTEFFPQVEPDQATITVRAPDGTDLEATDRIVRRIEGILADEPDVDVFVAETGVGGGAMGMADGQTSTNQARITVEFLPTALRADPGDPARSQDSRKIIERLRAALDHIAGVEISIDKQRMGPPVGADLAVEVSGEHFHEVGDLAAEVSREIMKVPGVKALSDDYRVGRPELRYRVDRGAAEKVGASTAAIANTIRTAVAGTKASALRDGKDEYDIVVELEPEARNDLQQVMGLRIPGREDRSPKTFPVPLSAVASFELAGGSGSIRHVDQDLVVTIEGEVAEGFNPNAVRAEVGEVIEDWPVQEGLSLRLGGADDAQREAQAFLTRSFVIAVVLILMVLVTQFDSMVTPGIIVATVALSLIGVLWGLVITGTPFGIIMTGIGIISLAGVVVNNAIVLLDYTEQLRDRGRSLEEALVQAGLTRFRPVMLTAITTILGLLPMALGISIDFRRFRFAFGGQSAEWWGAMAVAVIFGLTFATVLTLVMVPTFYGGQMRLAAVAERLRARLGRRLSRKAQALAAKSGVLALLGGGALLLSPEVRAEEPPADPGGDSGKTALEVGDADTGLSLDEVLRAAESGNADLQLLDEREARSDTLTTRAWATLSPKLSLSGSYNINEQEIAFDPSEFTEGFMDPLVEYLEDMGLDTSEFESTGEDSEPVVIQEKTYFAGSAALTVPLLDAQALPLLRAAYRSERATRLDLAYQRDRVRTGVIRSFYTLAAAEEGHRLASESVAVAEGQAELARRQVEAGLAPPRVALQARLGVSRARRELARAEEQRIMAREAFRRVTGLDPTAELSLPQPLTVPPELLRESAEEQALDERDDLAALDQNLHAARLKATADRLSWLPDLSGTFQMSYTENTGFSDDNTPWAVVFGASWTPWDGGYRIADQRDSASRVRETEIRIRQKQAAVREEVRTSRARLERAEAALDARQREIELARENLERTERSFEAGSATWLEVDVSRLELSRARLGWLQERMNRELAAADLLLAVGEGVGG